MKPKHHTQRRILVFTAVVVLLGAMAIQAQTWTYVDVGDATYSSTPNTFRTSDNSGAWAGTVDGTADWRFRNTGPAVPSFGTSVYDGRYVGPDPDLYTVLGGLQANTEYLVRVYGVYPRTVTNATGAPRYGAEFSLDAGTTWSDVDSYLPGSWTFVDNSSGVGVPLTEALNGDTRFFSLLPVTLLSDANGAARIDVRIPQFISTGLAQDRFNLDGYAVMVAPVPEPSSVALISIGLLGLWMRRKL